MNIQSTITELHSLGYHLYLERGQVRYKCLTLIEPPKDRIIPLLKAIKTNREAVIEYLKPKWDTLSRLHLTILEEIGRVYPGPEIWDYPGVREAEDRLNETWLACMQGKATPEDFRKALSGWEGLLTSKGLVA